MGDRPLSSFSLSVAANTALPGHSDGASLREPQPHYLESRTPSSVGQGPGESAMGDSTTAFVKPEASSSIGGDEEGAEGTATKSGKKITWIVAAVVLIVLIAVVLAVMLPVYFTVIKPKQNNRGSSQSETGGTVTPTHHASPTPTGAAPQATSGGDGSLITLENGTTFTYSNKFGGRWHADPNDPYNDSAQPNSWTPPLNQPFDHATTSIFGVNLGGLFVLEPFISPALFQKYPGTVDEWSLSIAMAADTAGGGLGQLENHYNTFITEQDIAEIAGAGLNWVRLPVPFWAIDTWPGEPFLAQTSWKYIVRVLQWCRKYGIRVNLDLHTVPGSANAYNHGGKAGSLNFLNGVMGYANAQRGLNYIRILTEFISQPEWKNVVPMFSVLNEPLVTTIGGDTLRSFYVETHRMMRGITGLGAGNGPYMMMHDSFQGLQYLVGFMDGADRVGGDVHPYFAFNGATTAASIDTGTGAAAGGPWPLQACTRFGTMLNDSRTALGVSVAGEFSNAFLDCGLFLNGVLGTPTYAGNCDPWNDSSTWGPGIKAGILAFVSAQMDVLGDYFFWTWKIGASATSGTVQAPLWSYQLGLAGGWMPTDPRTVIGTCQTLGGPSAPFSGTFQPYMVGGTGAGLARNGPFPWPPTTIGGVQAAPAALPNYTPTGTIATLPVPSFTSTSGNAIAGGNGWFDAADTDPAPTTIAGCTYPDAWNSENGAIPAVCH